MLEGNVVLIVDDDPMLLEMYVARIRAEGAIVVEARDGEEALTQVKTSKPSIVLLDIMMPKINGFDVLKQIKADPETASIPVIVLSALSDETKKRQGISFGAADYIAKSEALPLDVVNKIKSILDKAKEEKAAVPS